MSFIAVYITHPDELTAKSITDYLINQKIVACGNIFPIKSAYWWNGVVESDQEYVSLVKTIPEHWQKLQSLVEERHPYEVPCIMKIEVTANEQYEKWIKASVNIEV